MYLLQYRRPWHIIYIVNIVNTLFHVISYTRRAGTSKCVCGTDKSSYRVGLRHNWSHVLCLLGFYNFSFKHIQNKTLISMT